MDRAGIDKCVLMGWYWENQETCGLQNRWFIDLVKAYPDRLLAFAAVQPAAKRSALDALERALDAGLCGIGELFPPAQGFSFDDPYFARVLLIATQLRRLGYLHVTYTL